MPGDECRQHVVYAKKECGGYARRQCIPEGECMTGSMCRQKVLKVFWGKRGVWAA